MNHLQGEPLVIDMQEDSSWVLQDTSISVGNEGMIAQSVLHGTLRGVSDGSYLKTHHFGTAGWIFEDNESLCMGSGKVSTPGPPDSQCSYRSELFGLLCLITHVLDICSCQNVSSGVVTLSSDSEGAINFLNYFNPYIKTSTKHFDLLDAITTAIKSSSIKWTFSHVKGHQDDEVSFEHLTREAQLNVLADQLAKEKMTECLSLPHYRELQDRAIPYSYVIAYWRDRYHNRYKLHSTLANSLHSLIHTTNLQQYMITKINIVNINMEILIGKCDVNLTKT